jgi:hypothetical protein
VQEGDELLDVDAGDVHKADVFEHLPELLVGDVVEELPYLRLRGVDANMFFMKWSILVISAGKRVSKYSSKQVMRSARCARRPSPEARRRRTP